jgi:hypothetical protein
MVPVFQWFQPIHKMDRSVQGFKGSKFKGRSRRSIEKWQRSQRDFKLRDATLIASSTERHRLGIDTLGCFEKQLGLVQVDTGSRRSAAPRCFAAGHQIIGLRIVYWGEVISNAPTKQVVVLGGSRISTVVTFQSLAVFLCKYKGKSTVNVALDRSVQGFKVQKFKDRLNRVSFPPFGILEHDENEGPVRSLV